MTLFKMSKEISRNFVAVGVTLKKNLHLHTGTTEEQFKWMVHPV